MFEDDNEEKKIDCEVQVIMKHFFLPSSSIIELELSRKRLRTLFQLHISFRSAGYEFCGRVKDIQTLIKCQSNVQYHDKSHWENFFVIIYLFRGKYWGSKWFFTIKKTFLAVGGIFFFSTCWIINFVIIHDTY